MYISERSVLYSTLRTNSSMNPANPSYMSLCPAIVLEEVKCLVGCNQL